MSERPETRLARWPSISLVVCLASAAVLDYGAWLVVEQSPHPISVWVAISALAAVGAAAWVAIYPFSTDAQNVTKLDELDKLQSAAGQIQNLEKVATQITIATAQWQNVQEHNAKAIESAKQVSEEMSQEALRFADFMQKANDSEKATLRLEVEKLKRAETDWLQVLVRVLDHVYALQRAAKHSGQQTLIEQLAHFQNACRDAARRIGLVAFAPAAGDGFEPGQHQTADGRKDIPDDARVFETVATGYTFQGQMLRPALVLIDAPKAPLPVQPTAVAAPPAAGSAELPLT
ncbi:MAG: nucleotide exchange factor GrpE [Verrucomicrobia bacterium]|nr:nucleotide exchange factor GrpE [Verrucomicrobiota bacterium]